MSRKFSISLRLEIIVGITIIIIFTVSILASFFVRTYKSTLVDSLKNRTEKLAKDLANSCDHIVLTEKRKTLQNLVNTSILENDIVCIIIYDKDSSEIVSSKNSIHKMNKFFADNRISINNMQETTKQIFKPKKGDELFDVVIPIFMYARLTNIADTPVPNNDESIDNEEDIIGAVRVVSSYYSLNQDVSRISKIIILITVCAIFLSVFLVLVLIRILIKPIKNLISGISIVSAGDLSYRIPTSKVKEMKYLVNAFNSMVRSLERIFIELSEEKDKLLNSKNSLEKTLEQNQIMQQKLIGLEKFATIGKLSAALAHELKNPLASLQNVMYFFLQTKDFSDEKSSKMLQIFFVELERTNSIVSELLTFSRIEKLNKSLIYIDVFMEQVIREIELPKKIKIEKDFEHFKVLIDPVWINQILMHLILNARDAMHGGGTIYLSVKKVKDFAEIKVKDSGIGIKESIIKQIFEPLFTTKLRGVGLGLAIVKKIIDLHAGSIDVLSAENKGTEFSIVIPIGEKEDNG